LGELFLFVVIGKVLKSRGTFSKKINALQMSSLRDKIRCIATVSADAIPGILSSISEGMTHRPLNPTELDQLCAAIILKLPSAPPALSRAMFDMCNEILNLAACPPSFPRALLPVLKTTLGSTKKPIRESSLSLSENVIQKITPEAFWEPMCDAFGGRSLALKESAILLMKHSIETYPEFKVAKMARAIFALLNDSTPSVRRAAFQVASILYQRSPESVEKVLRSQFLGSADEYISRIAGSRPAKKPKAVDSELTLECEFEDPYPETRAKADACPFAKLQTQLVRKTPWEQRCEGLELLVAHARGAAKPDQFVREFRTVQDGFVDCLTDNRSSLMKQACLCLAARALALRNALDCCSDWIIAPLLAKTNNGTGIVAASASLAVTKYVANVSGKWIAKLLVGNADNASVEVRVTVVKSMLVARESWPPEVSVQLQATLLSKQKDPSDRVRALCIGLEERPIEVAAIIQDEEVVPEPVVPAIAEPEEIDERKALVKLVEEKNTAEFARIVETCDPKPSLIGMMRSVIELVTSDFREAGRVETAVRLLEHLCIHYRNSLYPFLNDIFSNLPEEEQLGARCLDSLGAAFGLVPVAKLTRRSPRSYANSFMVKVAEEHSTDIDFQCRTILMVIINGFYQKFEASINRLLRVVYEANPRKCEALFCAIPLDLRDDVVQGIEDEVPQLYFAFNTGGNRGLTEQMIQEIENAKSGKAVDFDLIQSIDQSDSSNQLLAIAAIRESREFDENFTRYLMQCTENKVATVVGAASVALQTQCEKNPKTIAWIGESFTPTNVAFKVIGQSIQSADPQDVAEVLAALQNQIASAVQSPGLKYSALSVLAKAVTYCGDQYRSFAGELSPINAKLLETMIGAERSRLNK
jgi:hypothetical protein